MSEESRPAGRARRPRAGGGAAAARRVANPEVAASAAVAVPVASAQEAALRLGIENLYPEQELVVADVLAKRDVLLVLPTGFGKSACYQIPSMLLPRPVVVVSPLLALLEDQHRKLLARGIRTARLDGSVRGTARRKALAEIASGGPLLVMTTPETLANPELREALAGPGVALLAVDEAHCISEWGYDFRPAYRRLGARLRELGSPPVLALTATATPPVREAIVRTLGMRDPSVIAASPHRSNLAFEVLPCDGDVRLRALLRLARRLHRPGIVYCATRREVEMLWLLLQRFGIPSHRYHGGMNAGDRQTEQERFMEAGRRTVMIATSAFGLGIDKPDIRYVLHFQAPASLEQYVQEAGRSGRDGRRANCILLHDGADRSIHEALLARSRVRPDQLYRLAAALAAWADEEREPSLEALALSAEMGPRVAAALLAKIEEGGLVAWDEDTIRVSGSKETFESDARALAGQFETLRTQDGRRLDALADYAVSDACRAVFLRGYFGEPEGEACGLCDVCLGRPARSEGFFAPLVAPRPERGRSRRGGRHGQRAGRGRRGGPAGPTPAQAPVAAGAAPEGARRKGRRRRGRRGGRKPHAPAPFEAGPEPATQAQPAIAAQPPREPKPDGSGPPRGRRRRGRRGGRNRRGRGPGPGPAPPEGEA
jgi:ATP-dependent DNA helicase RecQ